MKKPNQPIYKSKATESTSPGLNPGLMGRSMALLLLFLLSFSLSTQAQFIRINLDVEPETGLSESSDFDLLLRPTDKSNLPAEWTGSFDEDQELYRGNYLLQIRGNENFLVQARISHTPVLLSKKGESLPLLVQMAYRNDGFSQPPYNACGEEVFFPLNDSGLLIENIKSNPQVLISTVFVQVNVAAPVQKQDLYSGNIHLQLEYN